MASGHTDGTAFHFTGLGTLDQSLRALDDLLPLREGDTSARWVRICAEMKGFALKLAVDWGFGEKEIIQAQEDSLNRQCQRGRLCLV